MDLVLDRFMPKLVRGSVGEAGLQAIPSQPGRKSVCIVIATGTVLLRVGRAAEFTAEPDDGIFQQPSLLSGPATALQLVCRPPWRALACWDNFEVLIPIGSTAGTAVGDLDKANSVFAQPTRHQALATEIIGRLFTDSIHRHRSLGLSAQVEHIRSIVLHPPGQLIGTDERLQFRVPVSALQLLCVETLQELELSELLTPGQIGVLQVSNRRVLVKFPIRTNCCALICRWKECVAVIASTSRSGDRTQGNEPGHVLVLGPQPIGNPGPKRRSHKTGRATMHEQRGRSVRYPLGTHRVDEGEVVRMFRCLTKQFRNPASRLTILLEIPHRHHDALGGCPLARFGDRTCVVEGHLLAVHLKQQRLIVERVDVTRSTRHEEEDDPLRPWAEMRFFGSERIRRQNRVSTQSGQSQSAETAGGLLERSSSCHVIIKWIHAIIPLLADVAEFDGRKQ